METLIEPTPKIPKLQNQLKAIPLLASLNKSVETTPTLAHISLCSTFTPHFARQITRDDTNTSTHLTLLNGLLASVIHFIFI